ncbi:Nif3-like dinuclear metal center hexameric protein [Candidatus Beckwithbacteria bacterium CG10_big_fil_rev_8_21_14_0_10_34_10]|uniref:Nif3-like dinuclear metal center hexameric protein n=1 Tax=Candidatus Beckwithbacteria bacterium CG10_big_fil_rev_8_21_14_0_10_34_10 TaxID=1974495 RepID=A0A2H0W9G4_9BACT|nr:MAG: Nif3-like dinuclear metal center hexameric protein [Candidatus Beckwithbacteria bacterium CG10_big_fil_rev_8_21_14_0_10_34_10]
MDRDKLIEYINKTLGLKEDQDPWLFNGLQVIGKEKVLKIALGVSPNMDFFEKAASWGADMIILHHGLLGPKGKRVNQVMKKRLKTLFDYNITLLTYHLYLDKHESLGNNAEIIRLLGGKKRKEFGYQDKLYWGYEGKFLEGLKTEELLKRCQKLCGFKVKAFKYGPKKIKKFGVVSGGGPYLISEAIDRNLDAYLTGEARESTEAEAKEAGLNFIYLGHYNSEKFGVLALGKFLKRKFPQLEFKFFDVPNSL